MIVFIACIPLITYAIIICYPKKFNDKQLFTLIHVSAALFLITAMFWMYLVRNHLQHNMSLSHGMNPSCIFNQWGIKWLIPEGLKYNREYKYSINAFIDMKLIVFWYVMLTNYTGVIYVVVGWGRNVRCYLALMYLMLFFLNVIVISNTYNPELEIFKTIPYIFMFYLLSPKHFKLGYRSLWDYRLVEKIPAYPRLGQRLVKRFAKSLNTFGNKLILCSIFMFKISGRHVVLLASLTSIDITISLWYGSLLMWSAAALKIPQLVVHAFDDVEDLPPLEIALHFIVIICAGILLLFHTNPSLIVRYPVYVIDILYFLR